MKGPDAFCPKTGAPLSEDRHYEHDGTPLRAPVEDETGPQPDGELTTGSLRSRHVALVARFRRCHERHAEPDDELHRRASLALRRLKDAAEGSLEWDVVVWYALGERLAREGFAVDWMNAHAEPVCLDCAGRLKYRSLGSETVGECATNCDGTNVDRLGALREAVCTLHARAFGGAEASAADALAVEDLSLL